MILTHMRKSVYRSNHDPTTMMNVVHMCCNGTNLLPSSFFTFRFPLVLHACWIPPSLSRSGIETNQTRIETKACSWPSKQPRAQSQRFCLRLRRVLVGIGSVVDVVAHKTCGRDRGTHQIVVVSRAIADFLRQVGRSASTTTTHVWTKKRHHPVGYETRAHGRWNDNMRKSNSW